MPRQGGGGRWFFAAVVVVAGLGVAGWAATRSSPSLTRSLETLASSVASSVASSLSPELTPSPTGLDAGSTQDAATPIRHQTKPLSSAQLGAPLVRGTFVTACGAPDDMKVVVKVTVKMGRAIGVIVHTTPPDPTVATCIERAARELQWDVSPKTDHVTVNY